MRIQHNIAALNSHRQLTSNNSAVGKNLEKLSSGYRINRAGDDAAGLAISEKMRAQITGLNTASKNAQDGISLVQTAEGALTEVHSMLNRMTELAGQAANGTYQNEVDRENAMKELTSLRSEIDRISEGTNFNGIKLLDGSMGGGTAGSRIAVAVDNSAKNDAFTYEVSGADTGVKVDFKAIVGADATAGVTAAWANGTLTFTIGSNLAGDNSIKQEDIDNAIRNASLPDSAKDIKVKLDSDITFSEKSTAQTTAFGAGEIKKAAYATSKGGNVTNTSGAATNILLTSTKAGALTNKITFSNTTANAEGAIAASSGDVALNLKAGEAYTAAQINQMLSKGGAAMTVSFDGAIKGSDFLNAGNGGTAVLTLGTNGTAGTGLSGGGGLSLQIGDSAESFNQLTVAVASMSTTSLGINGIDIGTQDNAKAAVDVIKKAINTVSSTRGDLGAIQNRLEHTINNLGVTAENMTAAESRIRDVDMAQEMMTYTKNNILTQASQAMLAQANQLPQGVLQLLQ